MRNFLFFCLLVARRFPVNQSPLPSLMDADGDHADGAFFGAVDADDCVYVVVVERADLACAEVQADGC